MTQPHPSFRSFVQLVALGLAACCPAHVPRAPAPALTESAATASAATASAATAAPLEATAAPSPAGLELDRVATAIAAADRTEEDRALDAGRKPDALLRFFQIAEGMKVAELAAGRGYTAELLARVVGPSGKVYGQNSKFLLERYAEAPWTERLQRPINANIVRVDRDFDAPLPPEVHDLDAVLFVLFYHDTVWLKTDRARMNRAIFAALKPGGVYGVVDHRAQLGQALSQVETLHRIEESLVRAEIEAAGFVLDAEASFLENPGDTKDWNASPRTAGELRGTSDRFVLRYRKPLSASP